LDLLSITRAPYSAMRSISGREVLFASIAPVPTMERTRDRGIRIAGALLAELAAELRTARRSLGISQQRVARVAGISQSAISRTERSVNRGLTVDRLARHAAAVGTRASIKLYPVGSPVRDEAHLRLLEALRPVVHARFRWRPEAPVGESGDLRAWDVLLTGPVSIGIDAETRVEDLQALQRRIELKRRDSGVSRVILLVADTRHNRQVMRDHRAMLLGSFPLGTRDVLASLRTGRDPGADGIAVIRSLPVATPDAWPD
jgi:transcriptional regulator with XRE-family HTH domain